MSVWNRRSAALTLLGLGLGACFAESGDTTSADRGRVVDGGAEDTGRPESGRPESGRPEGGRPDGERPESGRPDSERRTDAGAVGDGGFSDRGGPDARGRPADGAADGSGPPNDGPPDALGRPDLGTPDARIPFECRYGARIEAGTVAANAGPLLVEASGLAHSRMNRDVFWSNNDNGNDHRLFALNRDGTYLGTFELEIGGASDLEDLAMGPGPIAGRNYLYLGDVGANWRIWGCSERNVDTGDCTGCLTIPARCGGICDCHMRDLKVFRVEEPAVDPDQAFSAVTGVVAETITLQFPPSMLGLRQDVEAMMVDPLNGDLYVATKHTTPAMLFRAAAPLSTAQPMVMEYVADLPWGGDNQATGADISSDGRFVGVRRYGDVHIWERPRGATVAQAVQAEGCVRPAGEIQGESFAFDTDDSGAFYTLSESAGSPTVPLYYYPRE